MNTEIAVPGDVSPLERLIDIKNQEIAEIVEKYERRKSPYRKWVQMNNDEYAYEADDWLVANSPTAYRVFRFLISNMDKLNALICSYKVMQEKLRLSRTTIAEAVKFLKDHKYINVVRTGGSNIYLINNTLYWNSWGSNYAYAEFGAKVIISSSEQDKILQHDIQIQIKKRQEVVLKDETAV